MDNPRVFEFLQETIARGNRSVLVTVTSVSGSSMRNPGAHMAVRDDGAFVGSLSGGCIEAAVVAEALECMEAGTPRIVRFGEGSRYLDIRLPCGGGLDVHFLPDLSENIVRSCCNSIKQREPFGLSLPVESGDASFLDRWTETRLDAEEKTFRVGHWPNPRILVIGHGETVKCLARQGRSFGADIGVLTSDAALADDLKAEGFAAHHLKSTREIDAITADPWTAVAFMFHDHDWEVELIPHAIYQPHFYLGAMGGRKAHAFRRDTLLAAGIGEAQIEEIFAPIGVFHSSRDPETLALSTLAQIVKVYHEQDFAKQRNTSKPAKE
jgi:xanthine dehydrogenase accessory factor